MRIPSRLSSRNPCAAIASARRPITQKQRKKMPPQSTSHHQPQKPRLCRHVGKDDGRIRHELLPNGRYDEARGSRQSAYQGRYVVTWQPDQLLGRYRIHGGWLFVDENTLHHAGMILRRQ